MMHIICTAIVEDERQRKNLCDCVGILGEKPCVSGNTVCVEYEGAISTIAKLIELFEQYPVHGISTLS